MYKKRRSALVFFILVISTFAVVFSGCGEDDILAMLPGTGYLACTFDGQSFLAVGTGGRVDRIGTDGTVTNLTVPTTDTLTDVWSENGVTLISGANGTILYGVEGQEFKKAQTGTKHVIFGVASFNGMYFASSENGVILASTDGLKWNKVKTDTSNNIVSITAGDNMLMAITRETDYIVSKDGLTWTSKNFNAEYKGYYSEYSFTSIRGMGPSFFIVGGLAENPGIPLIMFTDSGGEVWMHKPLSQINGEDLPEDFNLRVYSIGLELDQLVAACDAGRLLTVTECSTCNTMSEFYENDLYDLSFGNGKLLVVGQNFVFDVMDGDTNRQYNIKAEQALEDFQNGAVIIDVRTDEEYAEGHIKGSLHIPVDRIADELMSAVPDTGAQIIFYCKAGSRSQTALETALDMGYRRVYNLGGISDWPYDIER